MTPFEAMFGIEAFEAWSEVDLGQADDEPDVLPETLFLSHKKLLSKAMKERVRGKFQYGKAVRETQYAAGDRDLAGGRSASQPDRSGDIGSSGVIVRTERSRRLEEEVPCPLSIGTRT